MTDYIKQNIFKIIVLILIVIIVFIAKRTPDSSINTLKTESELLNILNQEETVIIDVRTTDEYNLGHIPRAINIPYNEIEDKVNHDKDTTILVYSNNDSRSYLAKVVLKDMGYSNIYEGNLADYKGDLITE